MKLLPHHKLPSSSSVALFTGAWIETSNNAFDSVDGIVALFTGAWIETRIADTYCAASQVALFTGAWIETDNVDGIQSVPLRRALYGRVD